MAPAPEFFLEALEMKRRKKEKQEKRGKRSIGKRRERPHEEERREESILPVRAEERGELQRTETSLPTERAEETAHTGEPVKTSEEMDKGGDRTHLGIWLVMSSVLTLALALLAGAWLYSRHLEAELPDGEDSAESDTEDARIVFVRQDLGENGILSTQELYAACAETVVSILTERGGDSGIGSGFLLSEDGYIGTAYHVVAQADRCEVVLSDGRRYSATAVAGDELTDLALLKIDAEGLPCVRLGSSDDLLVGDRVYAIGTPASLDFAGSLGSGEVSYLRRTVRILSESTGTAEKRMTLIQTTVPLNPGHSGCPLFDEYGRLVGVITMRLGSSYSGVGFAIPSDGAGPILEAMMAGEPLSDELLSAVATSAPKLGILGEADRIEGVYGVRIQEIPEGSEAGQALKEGDLILSIDGKPVCSLSDVERSLRDKTPSETVQVTVMRGNQSLTFEVKLGK